MQENWKPKRVWRSDFPYYKIQVYDSTVSSWKDLQKAYNSVEEAELEAAAKNLKEDNYRIMVVASRKNRYLYKK